MAENETQQQTGVDPEWFGKALELAGTGMGAEEIATAVEKSASTVRKLIKRKTESGEFVPPASGLAGGVQQTETIVSPEQAAKLQGLAGDSAGDDPEPELFPMGSVEGDGFSHKTMIKAGMSTEITVSMMSAEVPMPGGSGLLDPAKDGHLLVTYEVADAGRPLPQREGERPNRKVVGYKIRQQVRPVHVERVTGDAVQVQAAFRAILDADQKNAGQLLDQLQAAYRAALAQ